MGYFPAQNEEWEDITSILTFNSNVSNHSDFKLYKNRHNMLKAEGNLGMTLAAGAYTIASVSRNDLQGVFPAYKSNAIISVVLTGNIVELSTNVSIAGAVLF